MSTEYYPVLIASTRRTEPQTIERGTPPMWNVWQKVTPTELSSIRRLPALVLISHGQLSSAPTPTMESSLISAQALLAKRPRGAGDTTIYSRST